MKMNIKGLILLIALVFSSCDSLDQVVEIDLPEHTPVLVLNARIEAGSSWNVFLSKSRSIQEKDKFYDFGTNSDNPLDDDVVKTANILVKVNGSDYTSLSHEANGVYNSTTAPPGPGSLIEFEVSAPGFETLHVSDTLPEAPSIAEDTIASEPQSEEFEIRLSFSFDDPSTDTKDYYAILVNAIRSDGSREGLGFRVSGANRFDPELDDVDADQEFYNLLVFGDDFFDGQNVDVDIDVREHHSAYQLELSMAKVSEAFFLYRRTIDLQNRSGDNPFAEPVPIYTNVEGGLGVLSTSTSTVLYSAAVNTIAREDLIGRWDAEDQVSWTSPEDPPRYIYSDQAEMSIAFDDAGSFSMIFNQPDTVWRDGQTIELNLEGTWTYPNGEVVLQIGESFLEGEHRLRVDRFDRLYLFGLMNDNDGGNFSVTLNKQE